VLQRNVIADQVFVIVALPNRCTLGVAKLVDAPCRGALERADDGGDRSRYRFAETFRGTETEIP
jgi:hypothetical protein